MKTLRTTLYCVAALAISVAFSACWTNNPVNTDPVTPPVASIPANPEDNADFVRDIATATDVLTFGGSLALQYAVDGVERLEYAKLLSGSGHVFEAAATGTVPTPDQVKNAYSAYFPNSSENYVNVANMAALAVSKLPAIIKRYVPAHIAKSKPAVYAAYVNYGLRALAKAAYDTADPVLKEAAGQ